MRKALIALSISLSIVVLPALAVGDNNRNVHAQSARWEAKIDDYLIVDLTKNRGHLVRGDHSAFRSFEAITGQERTVRYLGLRYYAATPERQWEAREKTNQPDRITYGKNGDFLRLYYKGEPTHYGIHSHRYASVMFEKENRYQSMGCIIVTEEWLEVLEKIFELNGNHLRVITTKKTDF